MSLCECGCGGIVVGKGKRFLKGHSSKMPETRHKISLTLMGHKVEQETREVLSKKGKQKWENDEYRNHQSIVHTGKKDTEETKKKKSIAANRQENKERQSAMAKERWKDSKYRDIILKSIKRMWSDPEYRERNSKNAIERFKNPGQREVLRQANIGKKQSEETIKKRVESQKKTFSTLESKKARHKTSKRNWKDPEYRKSTINGLKKMWRDPEFKERRCKQIAEMWQDPAHASMIMKSWRMSPNKKELWLEDFLNYLYPGEWKFVGDGQLIIAGKCPDFVNVNGKNQLIELYGDYWHKDKDPEERIKIFIPFGYRTLVIWERELKNEVALTKRIRRFVEGIN